MSRTWKEGLPELFRMLRKGLGVTQSALADGLGLSIRAVQSYEQGWREPPLRVVRHVLTMLALKYNGGVAQAPCWEVTACPESVRDECLTYKVGTGSFCWLMGSQRCRSRRAGKGWRQIPCLNCPILSGVLRRTRAAAMRA